MVKRGLGRGLEALLPPKIKETTAKNSLVSIDVNRIVAGQHQPRKNMDPEKLEELSQSIDQHGIIQPIVVKPIGESKYEIVAGERRWRACRLAGKKEIPAIIKDVNAQQTAELALIENIQRENLNQLEEAEAYKKLIDQHGLSQDKIAARVGKSRPAVANALRLLQLPLAIKNMLRKNKLTAGHAKAILSLKNDDKRLEIADLINKKGLNVRETEKIIRRWNKEEKTNQKQAGAEKVSDPNIDIKEIEEKLQQMLTTRVKLKQGQNNGRIEIYYYTQEELERILTVLLEQNVPRGTIDIKEEQSNDYLLATKRQNKQ